MNRLSYQMGVALLNGISILDVKANYGTVRLVETGIFLPNPVLCVSINNETKTCRRGLFGVPVLEIPSENSTKRIGREIRRQEREYNPTYIF